MRYRYGVEGFDKNLPESVRYIRMAAERGYAKAQCQLGSMYGIFEVIPQDMKKAFDLYMQAAVQGLANAQYNLGGAFDNGRGVDKDIDESFIWYKKSADQGYREAQFRLGKSVYVFIIDVQYVHIHIYNKRMCIL